MIREPVVAGQFYPRDQEDIKKAIERYKPKDSLKLYARAVILPHAGYIYSGNVAVQTVSRVFAKKRIVILGPNHTGYGEPFALWPRGAWRIPFGDIGIDEELAALILAGGNIITADTLAHKHEHSIEVELPILSYFFQEFKFVPIACGISTVESYREAAKQICKAVKPVQEDVLFVASTDMTHYEPDLTARKKDRDALESIISLDAEALLKKVKKENISMCGSGAVAILLFCMNILGAKKAHVALYQTSADAGADAQSVVGYAGVIIN
ncbi:MAG: AmmeMemoRadiSam system protein B [Candidatus Omnitrophota bacterium]